MIASFPVVLRRCVALPRGAAARVRHTAVAFRADRGGNVAIIFALNVVSKPQNQCVGFSRENTTESQSFWGKLRKIIPSG